MLRLPEVQFADAESRLSAFLENEWELYDGVPTPADSKLSLMDILISTMMNSRLDTADKVRAVWKGKSGAESRLADIPPDLRLTDEAIPWERLSNLFEAFLAIRGVGSAIATKILYKKRPELIPILDSVIVDTLHPFLPPPFLERRQADHIYMVEKLKLFRELLLQHHERIRELRDRCAGERYPVTMVRTLEILLWTQWEKRGYYRGGQSAA
ncbi:MAG: DUF6308 family protein [Armatimonadota bacterium]